MSLRFERPFSDEEVVAAFSLVLPPERAREEALAFNQAPSMVGFDTATAEELAASPVKGPVSYDGDFLDLMSLVSESCALRAWQLLGVTEDEGRRRRELFRARLG